MRHQIKITGLKVWAHHGVLEHERQLGQEFIIDATVWADLPRELNDDLQNTINYAALADALVQNAKANPVNLLETLVERLLRVAIEVGGKSVRKVEITVHKPSAPIDAQFSDVSVTAKLKQSARASRASKND